MEEEEAIPKPKVKEEITEIEGHPYIIKHEIHPIYGERISLKRIKSPEELMKEKEARRKMVKEIATKLGVGTVKVLKWIGKETEEGLKDISKWMEERKKKKLEEEVKAEKVEE